MEALRLTYLLSYYPGLTTTFVDREVAVMREMGVNLRILAVNQPNSILSPAQKEIQSIVTYLQPYRRQAVLLAHLRMAWKHPLRYFSTMMYILLILTRPHRTFKHRRKTLWHFMMGVMAADFLMHDPPDHLHVHIVNLSIMALVISRMLNIPYSVTAHASGDIFIKPVLLKEEFGSAKFVATCTRYNQAYLKQIGKGVFDEKVKCIYHGLDTCYYKRNRPIRKTQRPVILGVGQLKERKGFQILIDALGLLHQRGLNFECRIAGEGPLRGVMEDQIQRLDLGDQVKLLGALPHEGVFAQYEEANIFALPAVEARDGDRDGIPNVILEAMAMELPVVSTWHSGIPEAVIDGKNGLLVSPSDPKALADALARLIQNPEMRDMYGENGRNTVTSLFNPQKNARILLNEIREDYQ